MVNYKSYTQSTAPLLYNCSPITCYSHWLFSIFLERSCWS